MENSRSSNFDYDVAISFAGEDRDVAEQIANLLTASGIRVFYDKYEEADLWGKDLYQHLADIYTNRARFCLILISAHYSKKLWTRHELQNAFVRAFRENEEYILPLKLDDTTLPGIRPTIGYQDLRQTSVLKMVELILNKLDKARLDGNDNQQMDLSGVIPESARIPMPTIKRQFSDRDKATFLRNSFEGIIHYFREGLLALKQHDPAIETDLTEITKQKYVFDLYRAGERKNACKIWISSLGSQGNISYREGDFDAHNDSSVNEWIYVENDEDQMFLKGILGEFGSHLPDKLTVDDAARTLWVRFIRPLNY